MNPTRATATTTAGRISSLNMVVDRFHFPGHVDSWCHMNCDPNKHEKLEKVVIDQCTRNVLITVIDRLILRYVNRHSLACHAMQGSLNT